MAEEKKPSGKVAGWVKAAITSVMGLLSGAVLMYVSPLVTSAIKPGKPLANFGQHAEGLTVTFQNKATGAADGWWDFGDGSPLEPFAPAQDAIKHTYERPGTYNVKLSLRNFLGDENDRVAVLNLNPDAVTAGGPKIDAFKVEAIKADAPAIFRVVSQVKNADLCVWSLGDDRPLEVSSDTSNQERYINIKEPGKHMLRLVAVSGKNTDEKSESVVVAAGNSAAATATLQVSFQALNSHRHTKGQNFNIAFPAERKEQTFPFSVVHSELEYQIVDAKFARPVKEPNVRNPKLTISPDKTKVILTGELVKPGGMLAWQKSPPPNMWIPTVVLTMEHRAEPVQKTPDPMTVTLNVPGTTVIPMPHLSSHWEVKSTSLNLELRDGGALVYKDTKLPISTSVQFKSHPYHLSVTQAADGVHLDLIDVRATLRPIGN
jgi:hypothetical protein